MESQPESPTPSNRRALAFRAAAIGFCALVVLLATSPGLPMGWDEGNTILRAERIAAGGDAELDATYISESAHL